MKSVEMNYFWCVENKLSARLGFRSVCLLLHWFTAAPSNPQLILFEMKVDLQLLVCVCRACSAHLFCCAWQINYCCLFFKGLESSADELAAFRCISWMMFPSNMWSNHGFAVCKETFCTFWTFKESGLFKFKGYILFLLFATYLVLFFPTSCITKWETFGLDF